MDINDWHILCTSNTDMYKFTNIFLKISHSNLLSRPAFNKNWLLKEMYYCTCIRIYNLLNLSSNQNFSIYATQ